MTQFIKKTTQKIVLLLVCSFTAFTANTTNTNSKADSTLSDSTARALAALPPPAVTKVLKVPLIPQQESKWCWAASMEMVIKFLDPSSTKTQCNLAQKFFNSSLQGNCPCTTTVANCYTGPDIYDGNSRVISCNIPITTNQSINKAYSSAFNNEGYYAMQDPINMSWENITAQIDACMPFVLILNSYLGDQIHAVVAKGYTICNGNKFVIINDPLATCSCTNTDNGGRCVHQGLTKISFPFNSSVLETIHHIRKVSNHTICKTCPSSKIDNTAASCNDKDLRLLENIQLLSAQLTPQKPLTEIEVQFDCKIIPVRKICSDKDVYIDNFESLLYYDIIFNDDNSKSIYRLVPNETSRKYEFSSLYNASDGMLIKQLKSISYPNYVLEIAGNAERFYVRNSKVTPLYNKDFGNIDKYDISIIQFFDAYNKKNQYQSESKDGSLKNKN